MWIGKYYRCSGCGEVYHESYSVCPCCKAPCQPLDYPAPNDGLNNHSRSGIVAVEIVKCERMQTAHLFKMIVSDGEIYLPIVSGAPNCRQGIKTVLARVGAKVPDYKTGDLFTVKKSCLRGEFSSGMLLSVRELTYPDGDFSGIVELPDDTRLGLSVDAIFKIKDLATGQIVASPWKNGCKYEMEKEIKSLSVNGGTSNTYQNKDLLAKLILMYCKANGYKEFRMLADRLNASIPGIVDRRFESICKIWNSYAIENGFEKVNGADGNYIARKTIGNNTVLQSKRRTGIIKRCWSDSANKRIAWVEVHSGQANYHGFAYDRSFTKGQRVYLDEIRGLKRVLGKAMGNVAVPQSKEMMGTIERCWRDIANKRIVWVEVKSGQTRYRGFTYDGSFAVGQQIHLNELRGLERGYGSLWLRKP